MMFVLLFRSDIQNDYAAILHESIQWTLKLQKIQKNY